MIRQDDPRFSGNVEIGEDACVLFVYLYFANKLANAPMGVQEILGYISDYQTKGWIRSDMTVLQPDLILGSLGVVETAPVKGESADYECQPGEYELCMWGYTDSTGKWWEHAIAGDGKGNQAFDPLGRSHCGALGKVVTKRIISVAPVV